MAFNRLNTFLISHFAKHLNKDPNMNMFLLRHQALCIIYISLSFFLLMISWKLFMLVDYKLVGNATIYSVLPLLLLSILFLRKGKINVSALLLLFCIHLGNFIASEINEIVFGPSVILLSIPSIAHLLSSSKYVHFGNFILCFIQLLGHGKHFHRVFAITLNDEQAHQLFYYKLTSLFSLLQCFLLALLHGRLSAKVKDTLYNNYQNVEKINKELIDALESRNIFLSYFSHEVRNPLNSMSASLHYLLENIKEPSNVEVLQNAQMSNEILLNLATNVLDCAKLKLDKISLSCMETSPFDVIKKALTINADNLRRKDISAQAYLEKTMPQKIFTDSQRLLQIVMNLLSNAVKFTEKDGKVSIYASWHGVETPTEYLLAPIEESLWFRNNEEFSILSDIYEGDDRSNSSLIASISLPDLSGSLEGPSPLQTGSNERVLIQENLEAPKSCVKPSKRKKTMSEVRQFNDHLSKNFHVFDHRIIQLASPSLLPQIEPSNSKGFIKFQVSDTGCGIAQENLSKLFGMFEQADDQVSRKYGGTGLGLWICKALCEKMGGDIRVYSRLQQGTTFVFYVAVEENHQAGNSNPNMNRSPDSKLRVLVIDESAYERSLYKLILESEGIEIVTACNVNEAMEKYKLFNGQYDFAFVDLQPENRDAVIKNISDYNTENNLPAIEIYLASNSFADEEALDDFNQNKWFKKPVMIDEVREIVSEYQELATLRKSQVRERQVAEAENAEVRNPAEPIEEEKQSGDLQLRSKRILIVDDDKFSSVLVSKYLKNNGFQTFSVFDGKEAVDFITEKPSEIDIILMDCEMPRVSGYEATQQIRTLNIREKFNHKVKIYGLSGHMESEHRQKCLMAGMDDVFKKPIQMNVLRDILSSE